MPQVVAGLERPARRSRPVVRARVKAVGLSIPGTVDIATGASRDAPLMAGWDGVPLAPFVRVLTDAPVFVDNDVNVMALSERRGHLERHRDLVFVKASTGIGAGIVTGGLLLRERRAPPGRSGTPRSPRPRGRQCRCGDTGCLEAVAAGWSLVATARESGHDVSHVRDLVRLATLGDAEARHLVRTAGRRIGEVLAQSVNLLNPEAIVVGGDLAHAYDPFVAGLRETLYSQAAALNTRELVIVQVTHGEQSGVVGCASLAIREVLDSAAIDRVLNG